MDLLDLVAKITLDSSEYERGLGEAEDKASKWGVGLGRAAKVAGAAIATATTAVTAFAGESVNVGMNFDKSMSQVAATMGTTVDQIENLREFAMQMGSSTAFSASEAADALNYMALAGYDAETSMGMLPTVLNLAASGNIDLAHASDMVTDAQSALGLSIEQTGNMVDQWAKTASKSNTSVEQLGEAILTIGSTATMMAGGTDRLATVLGILADNGIKGSEAGTHLRNMMLKLSAPTDEGAAAMEELGLKAFDSSGHMRDMQDIIADLSNALEGVSDERKIQYISQIFNARDIGAVNALLQTSTDRWNELGDAILDSTGAAEQMANTQLDNLAGDITMFKSALEGAQIVISDQLTPNLREFVQFGTEAISTLSTAFQEGGLAGAMDALGTILSDGLAMIISELPTFVSAGMELLNSLGMGIINNLPLLIDAAIEIIFTLTDGLIDALPQLIPAIIAVILTITEKLTDPETIMQLIQAAFQIMRAIFDGLINAIPQVVSAIPTILFNLIEAILRFIPQLIASGTELMVEFALGIARGAVNVVQGIVDILNSIGDRIRERVEGVKQWGSDLIHNFIDGIVGAAGHLWDALKGIAQGVRNFLGFSEPKEGPLSNFHTYAPDMMALFAKGIRDNEDMLYRTVEDAFDFGDVTINATKQNVGNAATSQGQGNSPLQPITIVVQSVLDGKVIGETAYKYQRDKARAVG